MQKRTKSEAKELASNLHAFFGDRDISFTNCDIVVCPCTKPRGYWTGIPLILQRNPEPLRLTELLIINSVEKVYIRHATCPDCDKLYVKEEPKGKVKGVQAQTDRVGRSSQSVLQESS